MKLLNICFFNNYCHKHFQCMDSLTNDKVLFAVVFVLLAFNISLSVVTIKSTAVKHTKLSLVCWQVGGEGWRSVLPCVTC